EKAGASPPSSPGGASELSPALQRWEMTRIDASPGGTTETRTPDHEWRAPSNSSDERFRAAIAVEGGWPTLGDRGCPTLALFARVRIRDLSGLGMLVVGICDFPPIEMHDGWGGLSCDSVH